MRRALFENSFRNPAQPAAYCNLPLITRTGVRVSALSSRRGFRLLQSNLSQREVRLFARLQTRRFKLTLRTGVLLTHLAIPTGAFSCHSFNTHFRFSSRAPCRSQLRVWLNLSCKNFESHCVPTRRANCIRNWAKVSISFKSIHDLHVDCFSDCTKMFSFGKFL